MKLYFINKAGYYCLILLFFTGCATVGIIDKNIIFYGLSKKCASKMIKKSALKFSSGDRILLINSTFGVERNFVFVDTISDTNLGKQKLDQNDLRTIEDAFVDYIRFWGQEKNVSIVEKISIFEPKIFVGTTLKQKTNLGLSNVFNVSKKIDDLEVNLKSVVPMFYFFNPLDTKNIAMALAENVSPVFYTNVLSEENINKLVEKYKVTKIIVYRILACQLPFNNYQKDAKIRIFYKIIKTDTMQIVDSDLIEESFYEVE
ncbi:MAG: hypothetical protein SNJ64_04140 [Endomicrobiia bacterium]